MSSLCAAPRAKSRTSLNSASSRRDGSSAVLVWMQSMILCSPNSSPAAFIASEIPSLKTISQSPGASVSCSSS